MIASTPVARWSWARDDETSDPLTCCLRDVLAAYAVLAEHRFATGEPVVRVSVTEAGRANSFLFQGRLTAGSPGPKAAVPMAGRVRAALRAGGIGAVDGFVECPGTVVVNAEGEEARLESLFQLSASSFAGFAGVELATHTDVWLAHDLMGRPQPEIHAANAPRLSALLRELSEVLGSETDPDDPTCFARPTGTGAENFFDEDGRAADVWGSFEVPTRYDVFVHAPGFGRIGYRRTVRGEVRCVPVRDGRGGLLGHLWASDAEGAASFEPRDVGDDAVYRAGLVWLERLRAAHDRGLSPSAALAELAAWPDEDGAGRAGPSAEARTIPLAVLREQAKATQW